MTEWTILVGLHARAGYIPIGQVPRDYWDGNRLAKPYEVIVDADQGWMNRRLQALPQTSRSVARRCHPCPAGQGWQR